MKNTNYHDKYKEDTLQNQYGNESVYNHETLYTSLNESVINTTKEKESLIKRLIYMNFKHHVVQYVIDVVT